VSEKQVLEVAVGLTVNRAEEEIFFSSAPIEVACFLVSPEFMSAHLELIGFK